MSETLRSFLILVRLESLRNLCLSNTQKVAEGVGEVSPLMKMICRSNFVWLASFLLATKSLSIERGFASLQACWIKKQDYCEYNCVLVFWLFFW